MSRKRRNTSSPESEGSPVPKRPRPSWMDEDFDSDFEHPTRKEHPRVDVISGQKGAFPGLDDPDGDDLFYGPANDGIEYLRMVRSEAKGVPQLLIAPNAVLSPDHSSGVLQDKYGKSGGYYEDGAYVAARPTTDTMKSSEVNFLDAQESYYELLCTRFSLIRATLKCTPPLSATQALDVSHALSFPSESSKARQQWRLNVQTTEPRMVQLACMDTETILAIIRVLTTLVAFTVRTRNQDQITRFGAWAWGTLARCKDRGELGSEEIADIRELGKRAVGVLVGIRDRTGASYGDEENEVSNGAEEDNPKLNTDLASAWEDEPKRSSDQIGMTVDGRIRMMLDGIITIVGHFYGQRDLLEFRDIWDEEIREGSEHFN